MSAGLTVQQITYLVILVVAFALLLTERIRNDLTAILIILALALTRTLEPEEALAGFSSEPAIVVAAVFVLSGAFEHTGLSETIGRYVGRFAGRSYVRVLSVVMLTTALLSAFTHHLTMTAIMLPVTLNLARDRSFPASRLLMPLSFAASLGTTITIIGAPAFIIASGVLQQAGRPGLGILSIAPIGLAITVVGTLFMVLVGRFILPARAGGDDPSNRFRLDEYFTELKVLANSPLIEKTVADVRADENYAFSVVGLMRNGRALRRPLRVRRLREGDVMLVRTTPDQLVAIRDEPGVEIQPVDKYGSPVNGNGHDEDVADQLVQAVVAPNSEFVGRTIGDIDFRRRYGAIVVSLWRRQGWFDQELAQIELCAGDVLVFQGDAEALARIDQDRAFLMLMPFQGEPRFRRKARLAGVIMLLTVMVASFGWLSIEIAVVAGAAAMIFSRCLTPRQAYNSIDARIFVFIAGALPLGAAMQKTGTSDLLAAWLQGALGGLNQVVILLAIFTIVAVLTQFMSDAATTAVFAPVAIALAQALGHAPEAYVVTVAMAAVASFLTPIGHHGNLLVYAPGGYQFSDFVRVGTPLTILVALVVSFLAPVLWP